MSIKYRIRDRLLLLPDDHLLPTYQKDHPTYDMMFDPIYKAVGAHSPDRYFVDVGANVGDTATVMRHNAANPILCVEGYSKFLVYLRENVAGLADINIVPAFIGVDEVNGPLAFSSQGGTGRLEVSPESENESMLAPKTRSLRSVLEEEGVLRSGVALFKTDTDGMDAFILREFLGLDQPEAALFFECDLRRTLLGEQGYATWRWVFDTLRDRGYSLIVFDNFGCRILSCQPDRYDLVWDLVAYIDSQFAHKSVHIYYLDIWAFPPAMAMIFEECGAHGFAQSRPSVESHNEQQLQADLASAVDREAVFHSGCTIEQDQVKRSTERAEAETQVMGEVSLEEWCDRSVQLSDLSIDLSRANATIQEQRRVIELLSKKLAEMKQSQGIRAHLGWRSPRRKGLAK